MCLGIPEDLEYQTKPEIGLVLLQKAAKRGGLPFQWVAADELYGDSPAFRDGVATLNKWYFTEIKSTTPVWNSRPEVHVPEWSGHGRHPTRLRLRHPSDRPTQVKELAAGLPKGSWTRATVQGRQQGADHLRFRFLAADRVAWELARPASVADHPPQFG